MKLSRIRVAFQILVHVVLVAHVLAYYLLDWKAIGALDFQGFFHHFLGSGLLTAGALLAIFVYGTALVFGRLFCSWGCHFGATQDLAAWILKRLGWKAPLLRTRFLHHAPLAVLIAVFLLPLLGRWTGSGLELEDLGKPDLAAVAPWDTLPGWAGSIAMFAVCGAGVLLFLGTRGFCRFVCPYGAVFRLTDFASIFRVRRVSPCASSCAGQAVQPCTAACPTAIDVHLETGQSGAVKSIDCVRCNLCVEACPSQALAHVSAAAARARLSASAVGAPDPGSSFRPIGIPLRSAAAPPGSAGALPDAALSRKYDLSARGEVVVAAVATGTFVALDLVHGGHFLAASLALAEGWLAMVVLQAMRSGSEVSIAGLRLRRGRSWTFTGITAIGILLLSLVPIFEAGAFKWLRRQGLQLDPDATAQAWNGAPAAAQPPGPEARTRLEQAADRYRRALAIFPGDATTRRLLLSAYARLGDARALEEAERIHAAAANSESGRILEWARARFGQAR